MIRRSLLTVTLVLGALFSLPALALKGEKVEQCVDLDGGHQLHRSGSQYLYIKNGADHYRLSFQGGRCGPMAVTSKLTIQTGEQNDRICPADTRVMAKGTRCRVNGIERIESEDYARLTRKR
jgi:hypothetical protein